MLYRKQEPCKSNAIRVKFNINYAKIWNGVAFRFFGLPFSLDSVDSDWEKRGQSQSLNRSLLNIKDWALGFKKRLLFSLTDGVVITVLFDSIKYLKTGIYVIRQALKLASRSSVFVDMMHRQ